MDLNSIIEKSLFVQNWKHLFISVLAIIFFKKLFSKFLKKTAVTGEYVGATFEKTDDGSDDDNTLPYKPALEEKEHIPYNGATVMLPKDGPSFYAIVNNRRSCRSYSRRPIPSNVIDECIRAAGTSPSGAHTEPWTFCVVCNIDLKRQIRDIIEAEEELNYAQRMHRQWTTDLRPLKTDHIKPYLTDAPYLILVFKQTYGRMPSGEKKQHYYNEISVAIATGILICALQAAGLSSLVTTPLNCGPALRTLLQRPDNEKLLVLLPVGYAADGCQVPDLKRKDLRDIIVSY